MIPTEGCWSIVDVICWTRRNIALEKAKTWEIDLDLNGVRLENLCAIVANSQTNDPPALQMLKNIAA